MKDPKEEAMELVDKFMQYTPAEEIFELPYAKQCALICIEEKKKTLGECLDYGMEYISRLNHLLEVEYEIEKL